MTGGCYETPPAATKSFPRSGRGRGAGARRVRCRGPVRLYRAVGSLVMCVPNPLPAGQGAATSPRSGRGFLIVALVGAIIIFPARAYAAEKRSGYDDASPATRAMHNDDRAIPPSSGWNRANRSVGTRLREHAQLRRLRRRRLALDVAWQRATRCSTRSWGARSRWSSASNQCRTQRQQTTKFARDSDAMLASTHRRTAIGAACWYGPDRRALSSILRGRRGPVHRASGRARPVMQPMP